MTYFFFFSAETVADLVAPLLLGIHRHCSDHTAQADRLWGFCSQIISVLQTAGMLAQSPTKTKLIKHYSAPQAGLAVVSE